MDRCKSRMRLGELLVVEHVECLVDRALVGLPLKDFPRVLERFVGLKVHAFIGRDVVTQGCDRLPVDERFDERRGVDPNDSARVLDQVVEPDVWPCFYSSAVVMVAAIKRVPL